MWRTWPYGEPGLDPVPEVAQPVAGASGHILARGGRLFVGCAGGVVEILALQPAGKGQMTAAAFLRGYGERLGDRLGPADGGCMRDVRRVKEERYRDHPSSALR